MAITFCIWGLMLYGYFYGVTNYKIKTYELNFKKLPASFNGLKVLQFSDTHLGSFLNYKSVEKGMLMIQEQNADIILFTGDLVNISSQEAQPYFNLFASLEAPYGKYAVLGNHDMSDYRKLDIERDSLNVNTQDIITFFQSTGFTVLRDTFVTIFNETDSIQIAGTDNWGKPPFKAYGNPEKLFENLNPNMFTMLLSHDPSFWCTFINDGTSVDLTLSGHTHGMQFGYRTKTRQWSPASIKYPTWAGIYKNQNQLLHVNPGFGFIGIPLRIGIHPEISVFILSN